MKPRAVLFSLALASCILSVRAEQLQIFAAASLTDALKEIAPAYEAASGEKLQFNFAASNALARQIQEGAPADVFISADEAKMESLQRAGKILDGTRQSLLSNTLAVVVEIDSPLKLDSAQALTRLPSNALPWQTLKECRPVFMRSNISRKSACGKR